MTRDRDFKDFTENDEEEVEHRSRWSRRILAVVYLVRLPLIDKLLKDGSARNPQEKRIAT